MRISLAALIVIINTFASEAQPGNKLGLKLVFYNVENFFDWTNDPKVNDEEFLPESSRRWSQFRFNDKASKLFKVFASMGEMDFPDIIGMTEVENSFVLNYLTKSTPMNKIPMGIVHRDSPDPRGIDACILFRTDRLKLLRTEFIPVKQKNGTIQQTREIVYASFQTKGKSVLHVFVNHWPSRRGGEMETQQKRNVVASLLRQKTDSLFKTDPQAHIVITGDFNDEPFNASISKVLKAQSPENNISNTSLYNLSFNFLKTHKTGTLKYRGNWSVFDQIIVSGSLLGKNDLFTCLSCAGIYNNQFLMVEDKTHMGFMPWRTYNGLKYSGGYSDHFPVYLNLFFK